MPGTTTPSGACRCATTARSSRRLLLENAQAGLSWETVLAKREGYRAVFEGFDPERVARMSDASLEAALADPRIVRHRQKVRAARANARVFLGIADAHPGGFAGWLWDHVDGAPVVNAWATLDDVPVTTPLSDAISKTLKRAGMSFVGSTTVQAWVQGVGLVDDHVATAGCGSRGADHASRQRVRVPRVVRARALGVHLLTATGAVFAMLSLLAAVRGRLVGHVPVAAAGARSWTGIDGPLARRWNVSVARGALRRGAARSHHRLPDLRPSSRPTPSTPRASCRAGPAGAS